MTSFRTVATALVLAFSSAASAADTPGVTANSIKIGGIFPFSGPASALGNTGKGMMAYINSINDRGGVNGRKIEYIGLDDAYSPPKSVEQARKLVEQDGIAFMYGQLGTPGNAAVAKYLQSQKVPTISIVTGSSKFTDVGQHPLTTTSLVSYQIEGAILAKYLDSKLPSGKLGVLFQNDDLGKDYVNAFQKYFGADFEKRVVTASYELQDPTVDSKVLLLKNEGVLGFLIAGTPKFAAQAIRKAAEVGWKPEILVNYPSASVASTLRPAGLENAKGVVVGINLKDPTDSRWDHDAGMATFKDFFAKYLPGADIADTNYTFGFTQGVLLEQILKQCGSDLSRENVLRQAKSIKNFTTPITLPGIAVNTSEKINMNWTQLQMQRWNGTQFEPFGTVISVDLK